MPTILVKERARLLDFLAHAAHGYTRSKLKKLLEGKCIEVNGQITSRYDFHLHPGDRIVIRGKSKLRERPSRRPSPIEIIYEDDALIAINKPPGLLSVETDKIKSRTAVHELNQLLKRRDPSGRTCVLIVHRIDRDASGILLFAKSEAIRGWLQENWKQIDKKYYAIVEGVPKKKFGTIKSFLNEDKFQRVFSGRPNPASKLSMTKYKVLKSTSERTLLEVTLETGRKNQIRVHLADLGHPIVGDEKYGAKTNPSGRLALHAYQLAFQHPHTKQVQTLTVHLPGELKKLVEAPR